MNQAVLNISNVFVACKTHEIVHRLKKNQIRGDSWVVHLHHTQKSINPKCTIYGHSFGGPTSVQCAKLGTVTSREISFR